MKIEFSGTPNEVKEEMAAFLEAGIARTLHTRRVEGEVQEIANGAMMATAKDEVAPPKNKGGRPKKNKVEAPEEETTRASEPVKSSPPPQATPAVEIPSDKEVQDALVAVNDKHGIDKAIECLSRFGVKRGRELKDEQKLSFLELCKSLL